MRFLIPTEKWGFLDKEQKGESMNTNMVPEMGDLNDNREVLGYIKELINNGQELHALSILYPLCEHMETIHETAGAHLLKEVRSIIEWLETIFGTQILSSSPCSSSGSEHRRYKTMGLNKIGGKPCSLND